MKVVVGYGSCGIAAGANKLLEMLQNEIEEKNLDIDVSKAGCVGMCHLEPIVDIYDDEGKLERYVKVTDDKVLGLLDKALKNEIDEELKIGKADAAAQARQVKIATRNCGYINPEEIDEYIGKGGYESLKKILTEMTPLEVIEVMTESNLRGRGGAGFPAGKKWKTAYDYDADQKYIIANADEGDPGAFMDRSILEGDPHVLLEGMATAGFAVGADQGFIYVRAEYPVAVERLEIAIEQAKEKGVLGNNIFGTDFNFDIELRLGAGAFVCGEGTALMESIEGKRGMPRTKIHRTAHRGLWQKPTIINNVETFANVPVIFEKGVEWFKGIGTETSPGTKVFALGGKVNNPGLIEVPMGATLREIIFDIGGGIPDGKEFKAIQTGGPSGGCIPAEYLDAEVDFEKLAELDSIMGSGGMVVMDEDNCMVDIARFFLDFTVDESCGKCVPCREGTKRMHEILERITEGKGEEGDIERLESLAETMTEASLCGLGQTAANPVTSTLKYFREEYEAHIMDRRCHAAQCQELLTFFIEDNCIGCTACAKKCPTNCISGKRKEVHVIDQDNCIKCGACYDICPTKPNAVTKR